MGVPSSADGRQTTLKYPVHQALVISNGFDELVSALRLLAGTSFRGLHDQKLVKNIVNMDVCPAEKDSDTVTVVSSAPATAGLKAIRNDIEGAAEFGRGWVKSNLAKVLEHLPPVAKTAVNKVPELLRNLIESLLFEAESNLHSQSEEAQKATASREVPAKLRADLLEAVKSFSIHGHTELQSGLADAFSSANWRKLAWYKLFWRVDDVPLIISDLVERFWLPQSERAICELTGRLIQSGISPRKAKGDELRISQTSGGTPLDTSRPFSDLESATPADEISKARQAFTELSISDLSTKAQTAMMKMLAVSTGSGALAALTYFSSPVASVYESGSILALGLAFALRKLQVDWEASRRAWRRSIFYAGSDILKQIESRMTQLVNEGGIAKEDDIDVQLRKQAQEAIESALQALKKTS
ncbi:MAG: hypothetical protein Q9227_001876 [Pyrenula ochraceoflavens]